MKMDGTLNTHKIENTVSVSLAGGLGNQLFQLAAGLSLGKQMRLTLEQSLATPSRGRGAEPVVCDFDLETLADLEPKQEVGILVKMFFRNLLKSISSARFSNSETIMKPLRYIGAWLAKRNTGIFPTIVHPKGIGYSELIIRSKDSLLIGFFHSYKWPEDVRETLQKLKLKTYSSTVSNYRNLAYEEKPIIVHVRLGDYRNHPKLGLLTVDYYERAFTQALENFQGSRIWVFSNELEEAERLLPKQYSSLYRYVPEIDASAANTLEVMRFGSKYVIGNSTFSWWAAYLSYKSDAEVYFPQPWFMDSEQPYALIPPDWRAIKSWG